MNGLRAQWITVPSARQELILIMMILHCGLSCLKILNQLDYYYYYYSYFVCVLLAYALDFGGVTPIFFIYNYDKLVAYEM